MVVIAAAVVEDEAMRRLCGMLACTLVAVAAIGGCNGSRTAQTTPASTAQSQPAVFPLTVTRAGGIAGFRDLLVVTDEGQVSVTRKGQKPWRCRLTSASLQRLMTAAAVVPWSRIAPANTRPSFPDDMVTIMQSPAGGPVRLEDPLAGPSGRLLLQLLNDISDGPAASLMCRPV
jgi:hypothetical protein